MAATEATEITSPSPDSDTPSSPSPSSLFQSQSFNSVTSSGSEPTNDMTITPKRYPAHLSRGSPSRARKQENEQTITPRRRPNSSQYETMEDLLAAAGYSVTRVFTPETERVQRLVQDGEDEAPAKPAENTGGRLGTLVAGWIAHIMPAGAGLDAHRRQAQTPELRVEVVEDTDENPFLAPRPQGRQFPQATSSLRHLVTRAAQQHTVSSSKSTHLHPHGRQAGAAPTLRHTTSTPSLARTPSARRRALPAAWRNTSVAQEDRQHTGWSGGFARKQVETQLKPQSGWFSPTSRPLANVSNSSTNPRAHTSPAQTIRGNQTLVVPTLHRARSAPRVSSIHVPVPAPPVRPSPVVQQNVVVCRSVSSLGSNLSVQTRSSSHKARSQSRARSRDEEDEEVQPSPILAPESTCADGLPPTPARPVIHRSRSNNFLRRKQPELEHLVDDEPDLASIIHAFRPPSAPASPAKRQRSIRSLRALLKDPRFPDVPVVCVASPGTVGVGGPGRAIWMTGEGWEAEVRRKNVIGGDGVRRM